MAITPRLAAIALAIAIVPHAAAAQQPAPAKPGAEPPLPPAKPAVILPTPPADYSYAVAGRRDPFVSLLKRGDDPSAAPTKRADGVGGLQTAEIAVRGIVQNRGAWAAIVKAPDGKVYTIRTGDSLLDGKVSTVTPQYVAVVQEVKDPLSVEKQREVRKYLRGGEEVK
jgi:Tfp pilus assembly protein PilP